MFSIIKKIAIAASFVAFCSGQLYASERTETDTLAKAVFKITDMPEDVSKLILAEASKGNHPVHLTYVCKYWHRLISNNQDFTPILLLSNVNQFLQECMGVWLEEKLKDAPRLKPSDLANPFKETFDLSAM